MADQTIPTPSPARALWARIDKVWLSVAVIPLILALVAPSEVGGVLGYAGRSLAQTGIFIALAVGLLGYIKATGAEGLLARAFEGREARMIVVAAAMGGLSPFCSCEVIPFIAAMLAVGAPLSAAMAFWLSSPLMDPAMFAITAGAIGLDFALAKAAAAVSIGLAGGFTVKAFAGSATFANPLRGAPAKTSCCRAKPSLGDAAPEWRFWIDAGRRSVFRETVIENALFLLKWMSLAYLISGLMVRFVPSDWIAGALGGPGIGPVLTGAVIGMPAYLNGYAAVPLVGSLMEQGLAPGAAMSFVIAGGVSCIPAALAVWPLVKPRVFGAYLGFGLGGAVAAGLAWNAIA